MICTVQMVKASTALVGVFTLLGGYIRSCYPDWTTKYFPDALLMQPSRRSATLSTFSYYTIQQVGLLTAQTYRQYRQKRHHTPL
jgi:hypothetical protein